MTRELLTRRLTHGSTYDFSVHSYSTSDNGWKISIQGKSIADSVFLYEALSDFLMEWDVPFKVATWNRYALINKNIEQSRKAMTIYCPDGMDFDNLCEQVYLRTINYMGWRDIKTPTSYSHYAGGLFVRNDRDLTGQYIPSK